MTVRRVFALLSCVAVVATMSTGCTAPAPATPAPTATADGAGAGSGAIAVIGDSMSLGVNACSSPGECPAVSWALGDDAAVQSVAGRLQAVEGQAREHVWAAVDGGRVSGALGLVDKVVDSGAGLVLVLIGANDACTSSADRVTPPADFSADYASLLRRVSEGLPDATILALSVPDLQQLWSVERDNPRATELWDQSPSCRSLLANAASDAEADVARRAAVDAAVDAYNSAIAESCAQVAQCVSDGGALHGVAFSDAEISDIDYFHASAAGQAKIAEVAWAALDSALPLTR